MLILILMTYLKVVDTNMKKHQVSILMILIEFYVI